MKAIFLSFTIVLLGAVAVCQNSDEDESSSSSSTSPSSTTSSGGAGVTVTGTITLPGSVSSRCYWVQIGNTPMTNVALVAGIANGTSFSYTFNNVAVGTYYLYAFVDLDGTCTGVPTSGDHFAYHGTGTISPPGSPSATVATGGSTIDFTLATWP